MPRTVAGWDKVGDRFYRRVELYKPQFPEDVDLAHHVVAGAPFSGAIALYREAEKIQAYRAGQDSRSSIDIYNYAGLPIRRIDWKHGAVKALGWSDKEDLLVVSDDGTVRCYAAIHGDFTLFTIGHGAAEHGIDSCRFWATGFVALLRNNTLVAVAGYEEPRPKLLPPLPTAAVQAWTIIPPSQTLSHTIECLVSIEQTIFVVDASEAEDRLLTTGPFDYVAVSPNGKFVALHTADGGRVWVITSDFQHKLSEYETKTRTRPRDMQWCGNDAVILAWEDEIRILGPNGASTTCTYDSWVQLVGDIDGVKVLSNDVCELVQKVPASVAPLTAATDVTAEVYKLGSTSPASVLLDALDLFGQKSSKADENLQLIRGQLGEAVDTCIRAAGQEYDIPRQKELLKAASFGKSIVDLYNSDDFVDMCDTLRVLNAVRFYQIGMPISYDQYVQITPEKLISRLVNRHQYMLALRLAEHLLVPTDRIYAHWALQKVKTSADDDHTICMTVVHRFEGRRGGSFEELASTAFDEGRDGLATELLNHEPRAGKQVPLLLKMQQHALALDKAIESGDTSLILYVLLELKKNLPLSQFFRTINHRPIAFAFVESSTTDDDRALLKNLYYQDDRRIEGANVLLVESLEQPDTASKLDKLSATLHLLQDAKDQSLYSKSVEEERKLLALQSAYDADLGTDYTGLSLNKTIFGLLKVGEDKKVQKLTSDFKVPDKSAWWIRLSALIAKRDWSALEELQKVKKSPIGWEPFFQEILAAGNNRVASLFIPKCVNLTSQQRISMWVTAGFPVKAGEEALKAKDMNSLNALRTEATGNAAVEIDKMIKQLAPTRKS